MSFGIWRKEAPTKPYTPTAAEWQQMHRAIHRLPELANPQVAEIAHAIVDCLKDAKNESDTHDAYLGLGQLGVEYRAALRTALDNAGFVLGELVDVFDKPDEDV